MKERMTCTQLRPEGCDQIQGYCFSRPAVVATIAAFIREHKKCAESMPTAAGRVRTPSGPALACDASVANL